MAANTQPVFPLAPKFVSATIVPADTQTVKTIYTAGANGGRVSKLVLGSTDTSARDIGIYINAVLVATVSVAIGAGQSSAVAAKDVFADSNFKSAYYDANGNLVIDLPASATLGINAPVTITAAKVVTGTVCAADF